MKVLVTGGAGHLGKVTVRWLAERGWAVRVIDRAAELDMPAIEYISGDIAHFETMREAVRGCQAVVHLAAIRSPTLALGHDVFHVNVDGTFVVYEAAAVEGIRRIAQASSINAIGCAYNLVDTFPAHFPIDEDQPISTTDPYSFSKDLVEQIGDYYWRRDGISSVSMRFPWVYPEGYLDSDQFKQRREWSQKLLDEITSWDAAERQKRFAEVRERSLEYRLQRPLEFPDKGIKRQIDDPLWAAYTFDRYNFWAFVDVRDAAQSLEKGITADYEGHHPLFINDDHNWLDYDSQTLIRLFFPEVQTFKRPINGSESLVSIDKARSLIGFEPAFSVVPTR